MDIIEAFATKNKSVTSNCLTALVNVIAVNGSTFPASEIYNRFFLLYR